MYKPFLLIFQFICNTLIEIMTVFQFQVNNFKLTSLKYFNPVKVALLSYANHNGFEIQTTRITLTSYNNITKTLNSIENIQNCFQ